MALIEIINYLTCQRKNIKKTIKIKKKLNMKKTEKNVRLSQIWMNRNNLFIKLKNNKTPSMVKIVKLFSNIKKKLIELEWLGKQNKW